MTDRATEGKGGDNGGDDAAAKVVDRPGGHADHMISPRLLAAVILTVLALLVVVVIVGLARDNLDPTGVATVLSTMFSGIVVGVIVRGRTPPPGGDDR